MTYSFIKNAYVSGFSKELTPEMQNAYKRIPESVSYIPHESFKFPATEHELFGADSVEIDVPPWNHCPEVPEDTPRQRKARKALSKEDEAQLFLRFNYARYRLGELTSKQTRRFSPRRSKEMVKWYQYAQATQTSIVEANMALVMAMARRTRIPHVDFPELISEGSMALLRAIEKFDVSRGFKFSTYACRAILKGFNRLATTSGRYVRRFPTGFDPNLERSDYDVLKHEMQRDNAVDDLREILATNRAKLTDIEQTVVDQRFALKSGGKKKTLSEVGRHVGLTTERVRQIQKRALSKLKDMLNEEYLAA
ncbi:MAG: sigma-70 family RNA polymerase sigma factor [Phycisphaerae bacterium]|jgi:RNA polymerase sigma factor (sigma-70 family)|nr:sigma-70 family RNA polymerase sigma factor [Phycisphaerae bacterium]